MTWTERDHALLASLFDGDGGHASGKPGWPGRPYAGYRPAVVEAPNGDTKACPKCNGSTCAAHNQWKWTESGHKVCVPGDPGCGDDCPACKGTGRVPNVDAGRAGKRFLHVALKYDPPAWAVEYLARAHWEACRVATALGVPAAYRPHESDGTLRVLEYPSAGHTNGGIADECVHCGQEWGGAIAGEVCPALAPGAGTAEHTDPNLFTIVLWRSHPADLELVTPKLTSYRTDELARQAGRRVAARSMSPGLHIGELGELAGLGPATPHRVPARPYAQKSIVYFAVPDHAARLPLRAISDEQVAAGHPVSEAGRLTVGEWLAERIARSRVYA